MTKHLTLLTCAALSAIALYAGVGARRVNAAPGNIFNLGTLGGTQSVGNAINNTGQVAGFSLATGDPARHAFRYDGTPGAGGAMADLGTLGGAGSTGYGINAAGQVAGEAQTTSGDYHPFRWTSGGTGGPAGNPQMVDLGTLGGSAGNGYAINSAGQVTGISTTTGDAEAHAFRTAPNAVINPVTDDLGTLGGTRSIGQAINAAGQVAGLSHTFGDDEEHAFLYTGTPGSGGAMADLGTLGGTVSHGNGINDAGQVAGLSETFGFAVHAFRYTGTPGSGGAMVDLGTLGGTTSGAIAINAAGVVVGFADRSVGAGGATVATLWQTDAGNTAVDLDAWLDANNPTQGAYWMLSGAVGINDNGLITGFGIYNDGAGGLSDGERAYILDASTLVGVPEPASFALLALGLPLLVWRNARRSGSDGTRGAHRPMTFY
jgi:probable HAF family extracellular repeat protein